VFLTTFWNSTSTIFTSLFTRVQLVASKVKQSRYTPWRRLGGEEYSFYSFTTSALDGGEWSASRPGRALPPGKGPPVPIVQKAAWAPEPVWTQRLVPVLVPNYKQHILSSANVRKVYCSLAQLYVKSVYFNLFGWRVARRL
jgi:hypothetical protein